MITDRFSAMGTSVEAWVPSHRHAGRVRRLFATVEQRCSRFLPASELSRLNASPTPAVMSPLLTAILTAAADAQQRTGGLVDPAVGGRLRDWGYDRTFDDIHDLNLPPEPPATSADWQLDGTTLHRTPECRLDVGGIAKGWTCDRAVEEMGATMVNAGGDLRSNDPGTTVTLRAPDGTETATVHVGVGALATSSTGHRRWQAGGVAAHHLIDPSTGAPAVTPIVTASVVADTAVLAEAGAKAVVLLGTTGLAWADRQPWIRGAVALWRDGTVFATAGIETVA